MIKKIKKSEKFKRKPLALVVSQQDYENAKDRVGNEVELFINPPFNIKKFYLGFLTLLQSKLAPSIPEVFNLLIVDDNPEVLDIMRMHMRTINHSKFDLCLNVKDAKALIDEKHFDVLILDWNLSDGNCFDVVNYLRDKEKEKSIKQEALVIVITGRDEVDDIMTLLSYNIKDYIIKPFSCSELEDKLKYGIEKHFK